MRDKAIEIPQEGTARSVAKGKKSIFKSIFTSFKAKILIAILLIGSVTASGLWFFSGHSLKKEESYTFVEQVQELSKLTTAEAYVKVILKETDNKLFGKEISRDLPGTKRELLLVVPATVIAGIDLKEISKEDIKVDEEEKKLEITLPSATFIQEPAIQMDKISTFSDEGLFRNEPKWDKGFDLAEEAQVKIKEEAEEIGLLQKADQNAVKVLKEFFATLGYKAEITFQ